STDNAAWTLPVPASATDGSTPCPNKSHSSRNRGPAVLSGPGAPNSAGSSAPSPPALGAKPAEGPVKEDPADRPRARMNAAVTGPARPKARWAIVETAVDGDGALHVATPGRRSNPVHPGRQRLQRQGAGPQGDGLPRPDPLHVLFRQGDLDL